VRAALPAGSVYRFLARERAQLFPPELFADLFEPTGRRSVPPSILAVVIVRQRLEGLSDREAADRFAFDVRWRYAAGVADAVAGDETASFAHTVLVDLRARLRRSADPDRWAAIHSTPVQFDVQMEPLHPEANFLSRGRFVLVWPPTGEWCASRG
jgi:Transposase domain (DUF772)